MVPSRCVKSEYMKRFKEPKWEACGPCYQELLRYRLSRRLLEQAHRPWFWDGWEQDSSLSSGGSGGSPSPPGTSSPPGAQQRVEDPAVVAEVPGEPGPARISGSGEPGRSSPAEPLRGSEEDDDQEKADIKEAEGKSPVKGTDNSTSRQQGRPPSRSVLGSQGDRRPAKSPPRTDTAKGAKHPFALYGWGEKQTDTGSQKTHNVCASASANEIHESALRAKNRRQMEKRKLSQRQINSAEVERTWRAKSSGPDNPWMTEYMRCYSARAR
ncbi:centriole, cilia and spindle-associated protein isoform X1 [Hemicordylus capensis]|uniref:centriole, cilia and spindle-associated protein isoform X1 n=1 Tax=Hemicordylus capensis TaxID=884348 RepID=UPI002303664B|nr:centriole, cilia and spindle-associated protein isoform X1 [Hemicordylus capensis]